MCAIGWRCLHGPMFIRFIIIPTCERQKEDRLTHNDSITLRMGTRLMPQPCAHFSKFAIITENDKICLLKTGNKSANTNVKNCSLYRIGQKNRTLYSCPYLC